MLKGYRLVIESGKTYLINHATRGYFALRVTDTDSKRIHGEIVAGKVRCAFGVKSPGDRLKLKISECSKATEQPEENAARCRLSENKFRER